MFVYVIYIILVLRIGAQLSQRFSDESWDTNRVIHSQSLCEELAHRCKQIVSIATVKEHTTIVAATCM